MILVATKLSNIYEFVRKIDFRRKVDENCPILG